MSREAAIVATLVAYKVVLLALGLIGRRRTRDAADFYLAGGTLGPVVAAVSAAASSSSAWTLLGVSGAAYLHGLSALWLFPACLGGFALNWYLLAPRLHLLGHATGAITVTEILAGPPDAPARRAIRVLASTIVLGSLGFYVCSQFHGAGKTFAETFELPRTSSILLGAGVVVLYTLLGGFWAVSLTDTLQGLLMAGTAVALPVAALVAVGGPAALADGLRAVPVDGYLSLVEGLPLFAGVGLVLGLLGIGLGYPGQPHVVNRFMALRAGGRSLVHARRVAIGWALVVYPGMILLGLCGRVLFPAMDDHEGVFIRATTELFDPVVAGVLLAAVLSAIMSTADSQLLVAGSAVTHDLGLGGDTPRTMLLRSRLVVLALSAAAAVAAVVDEQTIFRRVLFAWGAMGAAFGPLLLVRVWRGPIPGGRTLLAMALGAGTSIAAYYLAGDRTLKAWERVFPFALAFLVTVTAPRNPTRSPPDR